MFGYVPMPSGQVTWICAHQHKRELSVNKYRNLTFQHVLYTVKYANLVHNFTSKVVLLFIII